MWYISDAAVEELLSGCWTIWDDIKSITRVGLPWKCLFGAAAGYGVYKAGEMTIVVWTFYWKFKDVCDKKPVSPEKDVVYLCSIARDTSNGLPSLSSFTLKLETWLRMSNIKYEYIQVSCPSKKGLFPYIELNGEQYSDSSLIIDMLTKYYGLDPTEGLSPEQQGISRAFQKMMDENTVWTYALYRWAYNKEVTLGLLKSVLGDGLATRIVMKNMGKGILARTWNHGIGRHTEEEVAEIGNKDLQAVSKVLAQRDFLLGDKPTLVDCCLFGHLSQLKYVPYSHPQRATLENECSNIYPYVDRIKSLYWKDWDTICKI